MLLSERRDAAMGVGCEAGAMRTKQHNDATQADWGNSRDSDESEENTSAALMYTHALCCVNSREYSICSSGI